MSFDDTWPNASADGAGTDAGAPPEGAYEVALLDASAFVSKKGNEVVKLELKVVSTERQGYTWTEVYGFSSQGQASAAKAACSKLGVDVNAIASFDALDTALRAVVGGYYAVNVVRNGEYLNTYFEGHATPTDAMQAAAAAGEDPGVEDGTPPPGDDDIPF